MKKLVISVVLIILAVALVLTGCGGKEVYADKVYDVDGSTVQAITIDVRDREITVGVSDDNGIHLEYHESDENKYDIALVDGELAVQLATDKDWTDFINTQPDVEYRKLVVKIPTALIVDLTISTTNENVKIDALAVKDCMNIATNGGSVELSSVDVGKELILSAKNGGILGTVVGSYDLFNIACDIKKGECNLPLEKLGGDKSLVIKCNNGDVNLDFVKPAIIAI